MSEPPILLQMPAKARHLGVAAGFVSIVLVSLLTEPPSSEEQGLVELVRSPEASGPEASR